MIKIDSLLLDVFFEETHDYFINSKVQKIQQPTRRELILHLRNNSESRKLYININPELYHISFMSKENEEKRNIQIPKQPPMFCMLLRKHMEGAKILKVQKPKYERFIELYFENYNEIGDRIEECLSIELMGKHSNIVLYNTDNNIIIGCAHNIGAEKSKERELAGGLPFILPPVQDKKDLLKTNSQAFFQVLLESEDSLKKTISDNFFGFSQILTEELLNKSKLDPESLARELTTGQRQLLFVTLFEFLSQEEFSYSISADFEKYSCVEDYSNKFESVNDMIDTYFAHHIQKRLMKKLKASLSSIVDKELKKLKNNLKIQQKLLANKDKAEKNKLKADLLMSNLYALQDGAAKAELRDFEDKNTIEIELDENLSIIDNANKYYTKYNKSKRAYTIALEFVEKIQGEIDYYDEILFSIEIADNFEDLNEISQELTPQKVEKGEKSKKDKTINIEKREIDGYLIYIGKNNKQNDHIFSKISAPEDVWFHVLNVPGSHILVKNTSENALPDKILLEASKLAKEFSTSRNSGKVPIIYTLRKYVKKPPNQKGGMVTYRNETEIVVE